MAERIMSRYWRRGSDWNDRQYRSLSSIARDITGAHWSGPRFFGTMSRKNFRCAVYTRKSTEDGLDQDFNSLDAQREACEAYILSQGGLGWQLVPDTMMMAASPVAPWSDLPCSICLRTSRDRKIDIVVVYKIDRLTRSLTDFAKHGRAVRQARSLLRLSHPAVQHHHVHGTADAECPVVLRPVRTRSHGRAYPGQDRGVQEEGHVDGWPCATRLRCAGSTSSSSTSRRPRPSG